MPQATTTMGLFRRYIFADVMTDELTNDLAV